MEPINTVMNFVLTAIGACAGTWFASHFVLKAKKDDDRKAKLEKTHELAYAIAITLRNFIDEIDYYLPKNWPEMAMIDCIVAYQNKFTEHKNVVNYIYLNKDRKNDITKIMKSIDCLKQPYFAQTAANDQRPRLIRNLSDQQKNQLVNLRSTMALTARLMEKEYENLPAV